jgi:hypothetical protein
MRIIPTRWHGLLDYLVAVLLIALPALAGLPRGAASYVPVCLGVATIGYSLLTRYERGILPVIPMRAHLALDLMNGALLAASPWLFGFAGEVWAPHVSIGCIELMVVTFSNPMVPGHGRISQA